MNIEATKKIVGTWASLIGPEFYKPYMKEVQQKITEKKKNIFEQFFGINDYFEVFKKTSLDRLRAIVIVDTPQFDQEIMFDIEHQLFNGLNLNLTSHTNYDWLLNQGIMVFPRAYTWGLSGPHKEWFVFTDEVLIKSTIAKDILICTKKESIEIMLNELGSNSSTLVKRDYWKTIDKYYKGQINWEP